jgi:integrase
MAREVNRLSARAVTTLAKAGRHADGNGLYLVVDPGGARRWLFLFRWEGKLKEMGLGGVSAVGLADARAKALEARRVLDSGRNPIEARREAASAKEGAKTFGEFADALLPEISKGFRNAKHSAQWTTTLQTYAAALRPMSIADIGTDDVLAVLQPIWQEKAETASRVRGRIERVLDAAKAKGLRTGENPARWRGHLDHLLSRRQRLQRGHHAAMPYDELPGFLGKLGQRRATAARALEFTILNASRSNEALGARWAEFDLSKGIWTVPAERMKGGRIHRVPLAPAAIALLEEMQEVKTSEFVFPGQRKDRPLSNMAMEMQMRRMKANAYTVHGFRSSFRDWAGEATAFPREVAEAALSHTVGDQTERAYRRGDALEKRRKLMEAWAKFIGTAKSKPASNVTPIGASRRAS